MAKINSKNSQERMEATDGIILIITEWQKSLLNDSETNRYMEHVTQNLFLNEPSMSVESLD